MLDFLIKPQRPEYPRVWDNAFLWNENNIYIMANHRLALWCWLQQKGVMNKDYSLIHIDEHADNRKWSGNGEPECKIKALSIFDQLGNLEIYESLQCPCRDYKLNGRITRPCITWDNFVSLAADANLFKHIYLYSDIIDDERNLSKDKFTVNKKVSHIRSLELVIKKCGGKCILDIDLDFFDNVEGRGGLETDEKVLEAVLEVIVRNRDAVSMITISLNEIPGDPLWEKRQEQLVTIKKALGLAVPIPIMAE